MKYSTLVLFVIAGILAGCENLGGAPVGFNANPTSAPGLNTPPPLQPTMAPSMTPSANPFPTFTTSPGAFPSPI